MIPFSRYPYHGWITPSSPRLASTSLGVPSPRVSRSLTHRQTLAVKQVAHPYPGPRDGGSNPRGRPPPRSPNRRARVRPEPALAGRRPATLLIRSPNVFRRLVRGAGELGLGRAYVSGELDFEGDLFGALAALRNRIPDLRAWRTCAHYSSSGVRSILLSDREPPLDR
jgi:hypothetical protein